MLNSEKLGQRVYEEWIEEAISQISLYSSEWTNLNSSDPGITILENLTAFMALQQESIYGSLDEVRWKLLEMLGFSKRSEKPSVLYLRSIDADERLFIPGHQKFYSGGICFETDEAMQIDEGEILGIYSGWDSNLQNLMPVIGERSLESGFEIFGRNPYDGQTICLVLSDIPKPEKRLSFYIDVKQMLHRNKETPNESILFAQLQAEILTRAGYQKLDILDETGGFLRSGVITLIMPKAEVVVSKEFEKIGYVIKLTLKSPCYDIPPRIKRVWGFLFPVVQRESKSVVLSFARNKNIMINDSMCTDTYMHCFIKDGNHYKECLENDDETLKGNYYKKISRKRGEVQMILNDALVYDERSNHSDEDAVIIVLSSEEVMIHRELGVVYGYDKQVISLEPFDKLLVSEFCIMTRQSKSEETVYHFFRPMDSSEGALKYYVDTNNMQLMIEDPGDYEEAELILAGCAQFQGGDGNIRSNNEFVIETAMGDKRFVNPSNGVGGEYEQGQDEVWGEFLNDMNHPKSMVTEADYERHIAHIPGLCIHKVKAFQNKDKGEMHVVVKPHDKAYDKFTQLSPLYERVIKDEIEKYRMLTTKVILRQPKYVLIQVRASIYVKEYFGDIKGQIESVIREKLDYVTTDREFGEKVSFYEIHNAIEQLECVEEIFELSIEPESTQYAKHDGLDLCIMNDCLCYPGEIILELNQSAMRL